MRSRSRILSLALVFLVAPLAFAATAQVSNSLGATKAVSTPTMAEATPGLITGFRSARFGMSEAEVRAAIAKDFKVEGPAIQTLFVAEQHTKVLTLALPQLNPGPCPAVLSYILDARTGALVHVNVSWAFSGEANAYQRAAIQFAGERLAAYFHEAPSAPEAVLPTGAIGTQRVLFYAARDKKGRTVNVEADGVEIAVKGKTASQLPAKGPAILRVAYDLP